MDNDNSLLKWSGAAVGTVVVCFLLGYFILPKGDASTGSPRGGGDVVPTATPLPSPTPSPAPKLALTDVTAQNQAQKLKLQEEKKTEEQKQAEIAAAEEAARKAEADAGKNGEVDVSTSENGTEATVQIDTSPTPDPGTNPPAEIKPTPKPEKTTDELFRVRVGDTFASHDEADALASELRGRGFQPAIVKAGKGFAVQVGAFKERKGAEDKIKELTSNGYDAKIK